MKMTGDERTKDRVKLERWSDVDFAVNKSDRKSVTGGCGALDVQNPNENRAFDDGAEFVSASQVGRTLLKLRELLHELQFTVLESMWVDKSDYDQATRSGREPSQRQVCRCKSEVHLSLR